MQTVGNDIRLQQFFLNHLRFDNFCNIQIKREKRKEINSIENLIVQSIDFSNLNLNYT